MTDRLLCVLRHAKSDWTARAADRDRPLNKRGRRQAPLAGRWLTEHDLMPEVALVSPARRAYETYELTARELAVEPQIVTRAEEAYTFDGEELIDLVAELGSARSALLVGHNPACEELVDHLTGTYAPMKTAYLAVLSLPGWQAGPGSATLLAHGRPPAPYRDAPLG